MHLPSSCFICDCGTIVQQYPTSIPPPVFVTVDQYSSLLQPTHSFGGLLLVIVLVLRLIRVALTHVIVSNSVSERHQSVTLRDIEPAGIAEIYLTVFHTHTSASTCRSRVIYPCRRDLPFRVHRARPAELHTVSARPAVRAAACRIRIAGASNGTAGIRATGRGPFMGRAGLRRRITISRLTSIALCIHYVVSSVFLSCLFFLWFMCSFFGS